MSCRAAPAEELGRKIVARTAKCAVIGLGTIGSTVLHAMLDAGFYVYGYDREPDAVSTCRASTSLSFPSLTESWDVGTAFEPVSSADVVYVAVRVDVEGELCSLEPLGSVAEMLSATRSRERLIVIGSTVPAGTTRQFANEWMGLDEASPVFVAHCPERLSVGDDWRSRRHLPILAGALDPLAAGLARDFLETFADRIVSVSAPEVSEVSKLLENAFISINIALIAEIGQLAPELNITATEVCRAAGTKTSGYLSFFPGPGVGGHCLPNDLELLRHSLKSRGQATSLIDAARITISRMPDNVVAHFSRLLASAGHRVAGSKVLLVGIGFKPGCADTSLSPAFPVVRSLRTRRATPMYFDTHASSFIVDGVAVERVSVDQLRSTHFPGAIILAGDRNLDTACLQNAAEVILDTGGAHVLPGGALNCETL